jgi:hypothetical protein
VTETLHAQGTAPRLAERLAEITEVLNGTVLPDGGWAHVRAVIHLKYPSDVDAVASQRRAAGALKTRPRWTDGYRRYEAVHASGITAIHIPPEAFAPVRGVAA